MRIFAVDTEPSEGHWQKVDGRFFVAIEGDIPEWLEGADEIPLPGEEGE